MPLYLLIFEIFTVEFWEQALSPEKALEYSTALIRVVIVFILAWIATIVVNRIVPKIRQHMVGTMLKGKAVDGELEKRAKTISTLFRRTLSALIWAVAFITALQQAGFDIGPILATAGVAGLAVSFGAQNLVRDIFAGVFILLENQIRVGDVAQVNGTGGLVEEINLRTVRLRALDGTVYIFPNGTITTLANLTNEFSYYLWDLGVAYKEDTDQVVEVVRDLTEEMRKEPQWSAAIIDPLEVLGVDQFGDNAVVIKMRIKTKPIQQWAVGREMNRRIKKRFDELGIEIPFPHRTLYLGTGVAGELAAIGGSSKDRTMLKELVREVMEEMRVNGGGGRVPARKQVGSGEQVDEDASSPDESQLREKGAHEAPPGGSD